MPHPRRALGSILPTRLAWLVFWSSTVLGAFTRSSVALAAGPLGENGDPIATSDYGIDLYRGTVLVSARPTALGGAYSAIAEGVDGNLSNPAAPAVRSFYSVDYFDYGLGLGLTLPVLSEVDFFNTGERDPESRAPGRFTSVTPSLNLQWGTIGIGAALEIQDYSSGDPTAVGLEASTTIVVAHVQAASTFFDGQLAAGLGSRFAAFSVGDAFSSSGVGSELGVLIRPNELPFRIGAAFRTAITTEAEFTDRLLPNADGDLVAEGPSGQTFYFPKRINVPWDVNLGFAFQFGRPFNPRWRSPDELAQKSELKLRLEAIELEEQRDAELSQAKTVREKEEIERLYARLLDENEATQERERKNAWWDLQQELADWPRFYLLVTTSLVISGSVQSSVGVESYFNQVVVRSGTEHDYSVHLGLETEAIPDILKLRAGSYLEPGRSDFSTPRPHATFGGDVRLIRTNLLGLWPDDYLWGLSAAMDLAPRYVAWSIALIGWYPRYRGKVPRH